MKTLITTLLMCITFLAPQAQEPPPFSLGKNNFYTSLSLGALSFNFERIVPLNSNFFIAGKTGLSIGNPFCIYGCSSSPILPLQITGNIGNRKMAFEAGISSYHFLSSEKSESFFFTTFGLRTHPLKNKRFLFRIFTSFNSFYGLEANLFSIALLSGISIGTSF